MTTTHIDPELLAAFLDGTLSAQEREQVLRAIASSPAAYAEFSEAAGIRGALYEADHAPTVATQAVLTLSESTSRSPAPPRRWSRLAMPAALLAAAMTMVLVSRQTSVRGGSALLVAQSLRVAGATGSGALTRALGAGWDEPGWGNQRGSDDARQSPGRAFRVGVRFAQLEVAINAGDTIAVFRAKDLLQTLLRDTEGAAPLARELDELWRPVQNPARSGQGAIGTDLRNIVAEPDWFDLGVWCGAAQIAARAAQPAFFAPDGTPVAELARLMRVQATPLEQWRDATRGLAPMAEGTWQSAGGMTNLLRVLTTLAADAGR